MTKSQEELESIDAQICALDPDDGEYSRRYLELLRGCTREDMLALAEIAQRRADAAQRKSAELQDE